MKTKGAICWGPGEPWTIEELDMGEPVAGEVRIRLASSGMCHSDEHLRAGDAPSVFPLLARPRFARPALRAGAVTLIRSQARS